MVVLYRSGRAQLVSLLAAEAGSFAVAARGGTPATADHRVLADRAVRLRAHRRRPRCPAAGHRPAGRRQARGRSSIYRRQPRELPMAEPYSTPYAPARWASQAEFTKACASTCCRSTTT